MLATSMTRSQRGWPEGVTPDLGSLHRSLAPFFCNNRKHRDQATRTTLKYQLNEKRRGGGGAFVQSPSFLEAESGVLYTDGQGRRVGAASQVEA